MKKQLLIFAAALSICACTEKLEQSEKIENMPVFTAETDVAETRTHLDGLNILWNKGDELVMFLKDWEPQLYQVTAGEGTTRATLSPNSQGLVEGNLKHYIAVYPDFYNLELRGRKNTDNSRSYLINNIPFNSQLLFGDTEICMKYMPMIAVSADNHLQFKNMGAVLKFRVKAGKNEWGTHKLLKGIHIQGVKKEALSGNATAVYGMKNGALQSFYIDCSKGCNSTVIAKREGEKMYELNETSAIDVYIILPPTNFTEGINISLLDDKSDEMKLKTKPINIERNQLYVFPEITFIPAKTGGTIEDVPMHGGN